MLDKSPRMLAEYVARYNVDFWQLRTPLTGYALSGRPYGLDNGCFKRFDEKTWTRLVDEAREHEPVFVTLPDIVGDAQRTTELFDLFHPKVADLPCAIVLQDGVRNTTIPWDRIAAIFIGGSDAFKVSADCFNCCKVARMLGKWIHFGRVNAPSRLEHVMEYADSIDGSGISMYDHMLEKLIESLNGEPRQQQLFV